MLTQDKVEFYQGLQAEYDATTKSENKLYFTSDTHRIYKGEDLYSGTGGGGVAVQSDYTMNDPTDPSYIKNREFYTDTQTINGKIITLTQDMIGETVGEGQVINFTDAVLGLVDGRDYTVAIPSIDYEATLTATNLASMEVNYISLYDTTGQGLPLLVADGCNMQPSGDLVDAAGYLIGAMNKDAIQSIFVENTQIIISGQGMQPSVLEVIHKLPAKYIPDTEFYREITFSMKVLDPQPTSNISSGSMGLYFNQNLTYWTKPVDDSDTDFTLHRTEDCTDDAIGGVIFSMADRDDKLDSVVSFDYDNYNWIMGVMPTISSSIKLSAPNNIQYLDIDVYRRQPCPVENANYAYGAYPLYVEGVNAPGGGGYFTDVAVDEAIGVTPSIYYTSATTPIYKFNRYGIVSGQRYTADTAQHPYRIAQTHDHVRVIIQDNGFINCEGYAIGIMIEPISAALNNPRAENPKYYDRIPMSSYVNSYNTKYSDLKIGFYDHSGVFAPGDKIILRGKYI